MKHVKLHVENEWAALLPALKQEKLIKKPLAPSACYKNVYLGG